VILFRPYYVLVCQNSQSNETDNIADIDCCSQEKNVIFSSKYHLKNYRYQQGKKTNRKQTNKAFNNLGRIILYSNIATFLMDEVCHQHSKSIRAKFLMY
jgi:hypothetical protein